jgi:hypothetical protein
LAIELDERVDSVARAAHQVLGRIIEMLVRDFIISLAALPVFFYIRPDLLCSCFHETRECTTIAICTTTNTMTAKPLQHEAIPHDKVSVGLTKRIAITVRRKMQASDAHDDVARADDETTHANCS